MNKTVSRVLWIVAGVLLIVAGGACMLHPGAALSGLSFLLGMAMLFSNGTFDAGTGCFRRDMLELCCCHGLVAAAAQRFHDHLHVHGTQTAGRDVHA